MKREAIFINILFVGDIVGSIGRKALKELLPYLKNKYNPSVIVVNGENAANGRGITKKIVQEFYEQGVHGVTLGNHTWFNRDVYEWIDGERKVVRPANFPAGTPGHGSTILNIHGQEIGIVNLLGRTYMSPLDCPFQKVDAILEQWSNKKIPILVDFHAEATSEKIAMGWYLDGRVQAVVGTHTHVQTNDERILPEGTAYITDVGMVGPRDGVLGVEKEVVLERFLTQMPVKFTVAESKWMFHAVSIQLDVTKTTAKSIQKIRVFEDDLFMD